MMIVGTTLTLADIHANLPAFAVFTLFPVVIEDFQFLFG